jgi:N-formylglutamate amidohydrolase
MNRMTAYTLVGAPALTPLVLDSPHSGVQFPSDFDAIVSEFDLRDGEDCFVDELYLPATERGVPLWRRSFRAPISIRTVTPATSIST